MNGRITQSLACCYGVRVEGEPSQFVLERLAANRGIDYRFVTVQTTAPSTEVFGAARTLRFDSLVAIESIPVDAVGESACTLSQAALVSGRIDVVRRTEESWLADDLQSASALACLKHRKVEPSGERPILVYACVERLGGLRKLLPAEALISVSNEAESTAAKLQALDATIDPASIWRREDLHQLEKPLSAIVTCGPLSELDASFIQPHLGREDVPWLDLAASLMANESEVDSLGHSHRPRLIEPRIFVAARLAAIFEFLTGQDVRLTEALEYLDEFAAW